MKVASTPRTVLFHPATGKPASGLSGLAGRPVVIRRPGSAVLSIVIPPFIRMYPKGLGVAMVQDPCDCYYPIPGAPVPIVNGSPLPVCDTATGMAPACAGQDRPPCNGIPYGAAGYADCIKAAQVAAPLLSASAVNEGLVSASTLQSGYQSILNSLPVPVQPKATAAAAPVAVQPKPPIVTPATSLPVAVSTPIVPLPVSTGNTAPTIGSSAAVAPVVSSDVSGGLSFLTDTVSMFGYAVPYWAIGLGVAGVLWMATRKR